MTRTINLLVLCALPIAGCATTVTTPTTISSETLQSVGAIPGAVDFAFTTEEVDAEIDLVHVNRRGEPVKRLGESWRVRHSDALSTMFAAYLTRSFTGEGDAVEVEVHLVDVDLIAFEQEVQGRPASARMVRQRARIVVHADGEAYEKLLEASSSTAQPAMAIGWELETVGAELAADAPQTEVQVAETSEVPGLAEGRTSAEAAKAATGPEDVTVIQSVAPTEVQATSNPGSQAGIGDLSGVGGGTAAMNSFEGRGEEADLLARLLNETSNQLLAQAGQYLRSLDL